MLLLLARHGNTFEPGGKVVWAGARTDISLAAKGRDQTAALGVALEPLQPRIRRMIAGPLKRTREHAALAARTLNFDEPIEIEERLREIDYGLWEGKSTEEIHELGGEHELRAWNERGIWPKSPGWTPSEQAIADNVARLSSELAMTSGSGDTVLLVTSNGILKFFLKLVPGAFEQMAAAGALKVATGNCCALEHSEPGWRVAFWNQPPGQAPFESLL